MKIERRTFDVGDGTVVTIARTPRTRWVILSQKVTPRASGTLDLAGLARGAGAARRTYSFLADPDGVDLPLPEEWATRAFDTAEEAEAFVRERAAARGLSRLPFLYG